MLFYCFKDESNFQFDVLRFCETWLSPELESLVALQSFNPDFKHKQPNKEGGGLAIFMKNHLGFQIRIDITIPDNLRSIFDCLFVDIIRVQIKFTIGLMYRSPSHDSVTDVNTFMQQVLRNSIMKIVN